MVKCNRGCGGVNLRWKVINGHYKLFNDDDLLHICNDGKQASKDAQEEATASILQELGLLEAAQIPRAEVYIPKEKNGKSDSHISIGMSSLQKEATLSPEKMFTISSTASGIAITGDDKHNAIYIPKIAVSEMIKALVDFI